MLDQEIFSNVDYTMIESKLKLNLRMFSKYCSRDLDSSFESKKRIIPTALLAGLSCGYNLTKKLERLNLKKNKENKLNNFQGN